MEIHQLLPDFHFGDAISNYALELQKVLKERGYRSNIYVDVCDPSMRAFCMHYKEHKKASSPKNIMMFHYAIYSEVYNYIRDIPDKKIIIYHNITPHHFFDKHDLLHSLANKGRKMLKSFHDIPHMSIAVSEFNALELKELGFKNINVLPVIVDFQRFKTPPSQSVLERYNNGYTNLIFVGRLVPNKKHEDIIKTFYFYKRHINPESRLFLVGSYAGMEAYYESLKFLVNDLGLDDVIFTGKVQFDELIAYYKLSDLLLCLSEHEGFCVPLLEAMYLDIPVVAYSAAGVPYTLGKAGILLNEKNYVEIAELIDLVTKDEELKNKLINNQRKKLVEYNTDKIANKFIKYIEEMSI